MISYFLKGLKGIHLKMVLYFCVLQITVHVFSFFFC